MRIIINPKSGAMEFDATPDEAIALMRLQQGVAVATERAQARARTQVEKDDVVDAASAAGLTSALYIAWEYLVQHENVQKGVTVPSVARSLRITRGAASTRLNKLVQLGFAERIARGRYLALCP